MSDAFTADLWFDRPASQWTEALPLGNGRLGAMVFGGVGTERLQINDGTAWSGSPLSQTAPPVVTEETAAASLAEARLAVSEGDYERADRSLRRLQHRYSQSYLPFVDLMVKTEITGGHSASREAYQRGLNLATATHETKYRVAGRFITQRAFISHPHGVLQLAIDTDHPSGLDLAVTMTSLLRILDRGHDRGQAFLTLQLPSDVAPAHDPVPEPIRYPSAHDAALQGAAVIGWDHDGIDSADGAPGLAATAVHHAVIYLATQTTFAGLGQPLAGDARDARREAADRVSNARALPTETIRLAHLADHGELYDRVQISTGEDPEQSRPLDVRLQRANAHPRGVLAADPALAALLFRFGRYLLISSSRPGGVPANLQGIWNDAVQAPWSSNYTTNINLQMNYWPAEVANLAECATPLFDLIDALSVTGRETARRLYNSPGWVAHHNTDIWAYTEPVGLGAHDPKWAFWPMAGPWLVHHLWEHLLFGANEDFARTRAWEPIRSSAQFCLSWLQAQPDGTMGTSPSTSPENQFVTEEGKTASVGESSALDLALISGVLEILTSLAERLGIVGDHVVLAASAALPKIPTPRAGRDSMIPEWMADHPQTDPQHRHLSHLFFLYPGHGPLDDGLAEAAGRSLDGRGDESTGWSLAWKLCLRARLGQENKASDLLRLVFRDMSVDRGPLIGGLYPNFFAAHPPFQIDGNFGYVAGLAECILQSHRGEIELLKAIPPELSKGSVSGLVARPGIDVSVSWTTNEAGEIQLERATLRARTPGAAGKRMVSFQGARISVDLPWGQDITDTGAPVKLLMADFDGTSGTGTGGSHASAIPGAGSRSA